MSGKVQIIKNYKQPTVAGKYFRLLCMTGVNKGSAYYFKDSRIVMGRGNETDIQVLDNKASREHVELKLIGDKYILSDLNSHNGVIVNDLKVSQHELKEGDKVIIGETVYKYNTLVIAETKKQEQDPVKNEESDEPDLSSKKKKAPSRAFVLVLVLAVAGAMFFLMEEEDAAPVGNAKENSSKFVGDDFSKILGKKNKDEDKEQREKVEALIQSGLREHREGNYFRAINEYNLALVLSPNNGRASFYLNKTKQALDNDVDQNFLKARQEYDALKYKAAAVSYCSVVRILQGYTDDKRYKDAEANIRLIEKKIGMDEGEIKCF